MTELFTLTVPTHTKTCLNSIIHILDCFQIIPNTIDTYNVCITDDILHADVNYNITRFLKKTSKYIIYTAEYSSIYPMLMVDIWDDRVFIRFDDCRVTFKGDRMNTFLINIEQAYKNYKLYMNPNYI